jgi:adenosylcobinamide kinase / adenosylcobinamide-phosphate guanylyltransferase
MNTVTLVLGGARSGKSRHAEGLIAATGFSKVYIATAQAYDDEMRMRIADHQAQRAGQNWQTIDAPLQLADALHAQRGQGKAVLVDCLTLWLTNILLADHDVPAACHALLAVLRNADHPIVLVSNEVGLGIVPENALARTFRDLAGRLHQDIAAQAKSVHFIAAGLPLVLKG